MRPIRGVVMEIGRNSMVVYTEDGEFRAVPLPRHVPSPGDAVDLPAKPRFASNYAVAAAVIVAVLAGGIIAPLSGVLPASAAEVVVDSSASVQISLDRDNRVVKVIPLNDKARALIQRLDLRGRSLNDAVSEIAADSESSESLTAAESASATTASTATAPKRLLMVSVLDKGGRRAGVDADKMRDSLRGSLGKGEYQGYLVINRVDEPTQREAHRYGMSANRYLMMRDSRQRGIRLDPKEVREAELASVAEDGKVPVERVFGQGCWMVRRPGSSTVHYEAAWRGGSAPAAPEAPSTGGEQVAVPGFTHVGPGPGRRGGEGRGALGMGMGRGMKPGMGMNPGASQVQGMGQERIPEGAEAGEASDIITSETSESTN